MKILFTCLYWESYFCRWLDDWCIKICTYESRPLRQSDFHKIYKNILCASSLSSGVIDSCIRNKNIRSQWQCNGIIHSVFCVFRIQLKTIYVITISTCCSLHLRLKYANPALSPFKNIFSVWCTLIQTTFTGCHRENSQWLLCERLEHFFAV